MIGGAQVGRALATFYRQALESELRFEPGLRHRAQAGAPSFWRLMSR